MGPRPPGRNFGGGPGANNFRREIPGQVASIDPRMIAALQQVVMDYADQSAPPPITESEGAEPTAADAAQGAGEAQIASLQADPAALEKGN